MPNVGDLVPDFELSNQDGRMIKLSDYRGKRVVIFAYPKAGTSGCTTQACGFRDQFPKFEAHNIVILGISPDAPKLQAKWKTAESLPYDLLSDEDHQVLAQWGAWGEKQMYGKTHEGVIRSHWIIGEDGRLIDAQLNVKATDSVSKAVETLGW
ncbi:MAG: thioredoxin-dependent thiol peroxidase [Chloroflexota bacterium]|nr:thioredoxin-dependent thiol peroxidase [Chloroflexota bacterium]